MSSLSSGALTYRGVSFLFGDGTPYPLTGFQRGVSSYRVEDRELPRGDGRAFGRDYKSGPTHELSLLLQGEGASRSVREYDVKAQLGRLAGLWSADTLRATGGELAQLMIGDRATFGRPREFTPDDGGIWDGVAQPTLQFVAANDLWYGAEEQTQIRFTIAAGGGLRFPAREPFRFTSEGPTRNAAVVVGGDVATWPVFEIHGPVTNPEIEVQGVGRLQFRANLPYDKFIRVDTRPWARWVQTGFKNNPEVLSPIPGVLSPSGARLSDMALRPGSYTVLLRGFDSTGTAEMRTSVWPAYTSF
ncbi:hypothetical protein [Leucobacter japonicus]|uniref:hypothetical protein n=1 Tax=Leucobacter japonicus TaxID=1461259 RepID=UPI0006A77150|nr:hypothetical protein [Leucobacter japonicus]